MLAILRTTLRVAAIPRAPAEALHVLWQVLLASLPWLFAAPVAVALAQRWPWTRGHRVRTLGAHLVSAVTLSLADAAWAWQVLSLTGYPMTLPPAVFYLVRLEQALFLYLCLVGLGLALRHRRRLDEASARAARLESRLLQAKLHVLELQLHPHFLFNTLNAVSELVHRDAASARAMLASLRELLTRSLDSSAGQEIELNDELALLEPYIRIQHTRFAGSLDVVVDADPATLSALVPRLVLQPLVENAIRHGTARRVDPGRVTVRSRTGGGRLVIEVEDDGEGLGTGPQRDGLGLGNTRARLTQIHGDGAQLVLEPGHGRGAIARLSIPLRQGTPSSADPGSEPDHPFPAPDPVENDRIPASRVALGVAAAWLLIAVVGAGEDLAAARLMGEAQRLGAMLPQRLLEAGLWLALTGPVAWIAARLARSALGWPALISAHLAIALTTIGVHLGLVRAFSDAVMDGNLVAATLVNDLCVYAAIAAAAHAWTVREAVASRRAAAARLDGELAAARLELLRWSIRPEILFGAIDRIAALAAEDPERADELTGRLGELLRLMLDSRDRDAQASPVELSDAYLQVESAVRSVA